MKCLSPEDISLWLCKANQIADPHWGEIAPKHTIAFKSPANYQAVECFLRCFLDQIVESGELLFVVTDDEPSQPCQEFVSNAIRHSIGEGRPIPMAPGYEIDFAHREKAIGLFSVMTCFGWKCYLYASRDQIALYNWEGEIFDASTSSEAKKLEIIEIIQGFNLQVIPGEEPND